jgi:hypothetical protein
MSGPALVFGLNSNCLGCILISMTAADMCRNSSSERVNIIYVTNFLDRNETRTDAKFHVYWNHSYHFFKIKRKKKWKGHRIYNLDIKWYFHVIFSRFDRFCAVKSLKVKLT